MQKCDAELTPMRVHVTLHFTKILQQKQASQRKRRVQLTYNGESLTGDEIAARLESQVAAKHNPSCGNRLLTAVMMKIMMMS